MAFSKFRVLTNYEVSDPHPLILETGEEVTIKQHDASWEGWAWIECGKQVGWMPESYLDTPDKSIARVTQPFAGHELSAEKDEILIGIHEISGWVWCRKEKGETGWFPLFNLEQIREDKEGKS